MQLLAAEPETGTKYKYYPYLAARSQPIDYIQEATQHGL